MPGLPPFQGAAGYLGYDWGLVLESLPAPRIDDLALDDVVLGVYDWVIAWDHAESRAWIISTGLPEADAARRAARARHAPRTCARVSSRACRCPPSPFRRPGTKNCTTCRAPCAAMKTVLVGPEAAPALVVHACTAYLDAVARVREYIFAGDIFQANLSQRFEAPMTEAPWTFA